MLFNWLINPYDIYNSISLNAFKNKPLVTTHLRLAKARVVEWKKPEYIIMGSSTAETGINPDHPQWGISQVYNLGLPGANIYEVMRYLQHAQSVKPLKKVVLVLNFFMFNAYLKNRADFNESLLKVNSEGMTNTLVVNNFLSTLLSYDAINASIETIKNQDIPNAYKNNGQLLHKYRTAQVSKLRGYNNNFTYTESYNKETFLPPPFAQYNFKRMDDNINTIEYFSRIIEICEKNKTELLVVFAPEHVRLLETYKLLNLWEKYELWQKELLTLIEKHNSKYPSLPYTLWSFNKINTVTSEPVPEKNNISKTMHWFWDPFHFKNELGNLIINQILDPTYKSDIKNFSAKLTTANLTEELEFNKIKLANWENKNPIVVDEIKLSLSTK